MEILLVVGFLVVFGVVAYLSYLAKKKRQEAFRALAQRLGCRYYPDDPFGLSGRYEGNFPTLQQGSRRYAYNVVEGLLDGRPVHLFDHHHETYSRNSKGHKTTHHHHRTFVVLEHDADLGRMEVRPEHFLDKVGGFFGFDDIDFESEEFSRRFWVQSPDKRFAYDVLHPRMIEFLLAHEPPLLEVEDGALCISDGERRWDADELRRHAAFVQRFCELWPRHLVEELQG